MNTLLTKTLSTHKQRAIGAALVAFAATSFTTFFANPAHAQAVVAQNDDYTLVLYLEPFNFFGTNSRIDVLGPTGGLVSTIWERDVVPDRTLIPRFANSVSIDGDRAVIGSPSTYFRGDAHVVNLQTGAVERALNPDSNLGGGRAKPQFGWATAMQDGVAAIGAPLASYVGTGPGYGNGVVVVFDAATGSVIQTIRNYTDFPTHNGVDLVNPRGIGHQLAFDGAELVVYGSFLVGDNQYANLPWRRFTIIPEPSSALMAGVGLIAFLRPRRRRPAGAGR